MTVFLRKLYPLAAILALLLAATLATNTARADVFTNVSEASSYGLVYELAIPDEGNFRNTTAIPYSVDNSATAGTYSRIAYYLELDTGSGLEYVYISMDAFDTDATRIGLPHSNYNPVARQQIVDNMNVVSNSAGIVTGTGIATGNIEMWPSNYGGNTTGTIPTGTNAFDWNDSGGGTSAGYGSFQVHNHDIDGAGSGTDGQVLLAYNRWGTSGTSNLGIGNNDGTLGADQHSTLGVQPDWTFQGSADQYTVKNLLVLAGSPTTWNGGAGGSGAVDGPGTWDTDPANLIWWKTAASAWTDGENPIFGAGTGTAGAVTVSGTVKPGSITFSQTGGGNYTLNGGTVDFDGNEAVIRADVDATINSTLANGGIRKLGAGTLTLGGNSTYHTFAGALTIDEGTVVLPGNTNSNHLTGNPDIIVNDGATLAFGGYNSFGLTLSDMSAVTINSGGTMRTSGKVIVFNDLTLNDGTVLIDGNDNYSANWGSLGLGGTTTATGNSVISNDSGGTGTIANAATRTPVFTVNTPTATDMLTISARIGPSGGNALSLVKDGSGTLVLSGDNGYTGTTTVNAGLLRLNGSTSTTVNAVAGDILIDGGELQWGAANQIADGASIVLDSGKLWMTSAETVANVTINAVASSDFHLINGLNAADTLTISAGNVVVGSGGNAQANAVNMSGGVLAVAANTGSSTFTIGAGGLTMSGAEVRFGYSGTGAGLAARYNLNGNFTGTGTNTFSTPTDLGPRQLDLGGATRIFNVVDGTTTINADIQSGGLTKTGAGTLTLGGNSTYHTFAGALTIDEGTVRLPGNNNANHFTGNPDIVVNNGATLAFAGFNSFGLTTSSMSAVTVNSGGTIRSSGKVIVFNDLTLNDGTALIDGNDNYSANWGSFGLGGTTTATGNSVISNDSGGTGTIANAANRTPVFTVNTPGATDSLTISATVGPSGGNALEIVKNGDGLLTLTAANNYTGGTTVNGGTLAVSAGLGGSSALGSGAVTLAGGTLSLGGGVQQQTVDASGWNQDLIIGASETAPGYTTSMVNWSFYETGLTGSTQGLPADSGATPRTFSSLYDSNVEFQFAPYADNNAVYLDGDGSVTITLDDPGKFEALQFLETTRTETWYATLHYDDGSSTTTTTWSDPDWTANPGPADRALTSYGLKKASDGSFYTNYLWMAQRNVALSPADREKVLNSITFHTTGGTGRQLALFAVSGVTLGPSQSYANTVNVTADSTIDVRRSLAATLGPLSIGGHTLSITGDAGASLTVGTTTLNGNATFNSAADTALVLGPVADGGAGYGLTKTGDGTLLLNGANTYTGLTTVNGGTLGGSGSILGQIVVNSGTLAPGTSPGILTLENGVTFNGGTFAIELNGTTVGSEYDQLLVTGGDVDLGLGVADLAISTTGYSPSPSDLFWIINNTSTTSGLTTGYFQDLAYEGSSLMVDGRRFYIYYEADFETGLFSGGNDVLLTSVPEPSMLALIGTGLLGLGLFGLRRRRRSR